MNLAIFNYAFNFYYNAFRERFCGPVSEVLRYSGAQGVRGGDSASLTSLHGPVSLCFSGCFANEGTLKQKTRLLTYTIIASKVLDTYS